jgi:hypothetical protein
MLSSAFTALFITRADFIPTMSGPNPSYPFGRPRAGPKRGDSCSATLQGRAAPPLHEANPPAIVVRRVGASHYIFALVYPAGG